MAVHTVQAVLEEGMLYVFIPELYYVKVLRVEREGVVFGGTIFNSPVPDFKFFYFLIGMIFFRNPGAPGGEKIKIMYKV